VERAEAGSAVGDGHTDEFALRGPSYAADNVFIVFDLRNLGEVDAGTVDALARLQVAARRLDARIILRNVPSELSELLDLMGLTGVLCPVPSRAAQRRASERARRSGRED